MTGRDIIKMHLNDNKIKTRKGRMNIHKVNQGKDFKMKVFPGKIFLHSEIFIIKKNKSFNYLNLLDRFISFHRMDKIILRT